MSLWKIGRGDIQCLQEWWWLLFLFNLAIGIIFRRIQYVNSHSLKHVFFVRGSALYKANNVIPYPTSYTRCASPLNVYTQELLSHFQQLFGHPQQSSLPVLYGALSVLCCLGYGSLVEVLFPHLEALVDFFNGSLESNVKNDVFRLQETILVSVHSWKVKPANSGHPWAIKRWP